MRLLLDTCTFLWWTSSPGKLSPKVAGALRHPENQVFISVASAWEITIKYKIGRLDLPYPPHHYIPHWLESYHLEPLEISLQHVLEAGMLPMHHKDPFDRLLIAQALMEDLVMVTSDLAFAEYPVELLW